LVLIPIVRGIVGLVDGDPPDHRGSGLGLLVSQLNNYTLSRSRKNG